MTRPPVPLDPKEEADRRAHGDFAHEGLSRRARVAHWLLRGAGHLYHATRVVARMARGDTAGVRRILVVRRSFLGDLVVFLPTLAALRTRFPDAHITLGVHRGFSAGELLDGRGLVDEVRVLDFLEGGRAGARVREALRLFAAGYDLVLTGVSYFLIREGFFTGAPWQVGTDDGHPLQELLDERVPLHPYRHEAENNLQLAERVGAPAAAERRVPRLDDAGPPAGAREAVRARLALPDTVPVVAVHAGSKRPSRRWPPERFAAVITTLLTRHRSLRVVLTGTTDERQLVTDLRLLVPAPLRERVIDGAGAYGLDELVALLDRSDVLVSNDTGVMHVARAWGTPLVAILGPENDLRWGPHELGPAAAVSLRHEIPCSPCPRYECVGRFCLRSLPADDVVAEVEALLAGGGRTGDGALVPLVRRHRRMGWQELVQAGQPIPLVSVVIFPSPDGVNPLVLREMLVALATQDYPRLEIVVLGGGHDGARARGELARWRDCFERMTESRLTSAAADASWDAALREAQGDYVCPVWPSTPVDAWDRGAVGLDVATLMREPLAEVACDGAPPLLRLDAGEIGGPRLAGDDGEGRRTYRRGALDAALRASGRLPGQRVPSGQPEAGGVALA